MTAASRRPWLLALAAIVVGVLGDAAVLREVILATRPSPPLLQRGYFEPTDDGIVLTSDDATTGMLPALALTDPFTLEIPPGMTAVVTLNAGDRITVGTSLAAAPLMLFGADAAIAAPPGTPPASPDARALTELRSLQSPSGGTADLVAWTDRPWREDLARLEALSRNCGARPSPAVVEYDGTNVRWSLGTCSGGTSPSGPNEGTRLAIVAGTGWSRVQRSTPWPVQREFAAPLAVASAVRAVVLWFAVGAPGAIAAAAALAAASFVVPTPALLLWPWTVVFAVGAAFARIVYAFARGPSRKTNAALAVIAAVALGGWWASRPGEPRVQRHYHSDTSHDRCVLVGYSTVAQEGLRNRFGGALNRLGGDCEPCRQHTGAIGGAGETIAWAADSVCRSADSVGKHGWIAFWGGANDDLLSGAAAMPRFFFVGQLGRAHWDANLERAADDSQRNLAEQLDEIEKLLRCTSERRARLLFLHDFLVTDLEKGRGPARNAMLAARRSVIESRGGRFVDLLANFEEQAGVAWFSDYVHPSAVGHQRIAEWLCAAIVGDTPQS